MARAWIAFLPIVLAGCFPPAVTVASLGADGVSAASTGKTVTDHGISAVTLRNCSLIRLFGDRPICIREASTTAVPLEDRRRPAKYLVVVGSFAERGNAERVALRYASYGATVIPVTVDGRMLNRVLVGPLDAAQAATLQTDGAWKAP